MTVDSDITEFLAEARRFLDANADRKPPLADFRWGEGEDRVAYFSVDPPEVEQAAVDRARAWQNTRYRNGFGWISGPPEYGGRGLSPLHDLLYDGIESEYDVPDTGTLSVVGLGMVGPTILAHAQKHIRDRWLPAMYSGRAIACQLFSEPEAGSDLAGLRTTAERRGEDWVINGQKVWTSVAHLSSIGLALARTDPDAPKHRGITAFLVPMDTAGVQVRPLRQMTGGADFNEVFLTDVRVSDDHRLGEVHGGWTVALTTLMNERATVGNEGPPALLEALAPDRLAALLNAAGATADGAARGRLAELIADLRATDAMNTRAVRRFRAGVAPGPEMSVSKLMYARNLTQAAHFVADMLGPRIIADTGGWGTYAWNELLLATPALRILGGTEEIMKNILAERVLGLPKEPGIDTKSPFRTMHRSATPEVSR